MSNIRAFYILEKTTLTEDDKTFLKTHIETLTETKNLFESHVKYLKDIIDQQHEIINDSVSEEL